MEVVTDGRVPVDDGRFAAGCGERCSTRREEEPADPRETEKKIRAALEKHRRGEPLTTMEETVVYWHLYGGGCHACGGLKVAVAGTSRTDT